MKKVNFKALAVASILTVASSTLFAQPCCRAGGPHHGQRGGERPSQEEIAQKMTDNLKKELSLTEEQVSQIYQLNLRCVQSQEKSRKEQAQNCKEIKGEQVETLKARKEAMGKILTQEQLEKMEQMKSNKEKGGRKGQHGCPGNSGCPAPRR